VLFEHARAEDGLWWMRVTCNFLLDMADMNDFRRQRFELTQEHLYAAISLLSDE
jgi:hypothetical protein